MRHADVNQYILYVVCEYLVITITYALPTLSMGQIYVISRFESTYKDQNQEYLVLIISRHFEFSRNIQFNAAHPVLHVSHYILYMG